MLSIIGAALIIFSYVAFKDLRTGARLLLVQLSIADILVAGSHMFGVLYNLPRLVDSCNPTTDIISNQGSNDLPCVIQAGVAMYSVIATFLWTLAMAVYLLVIIVFEKKVIGKRMSIFFFTFCWGVPLVQVIVFGAKKFLGFDESLDIGWCYVTFVSSNDTAQHGRLLPQILGYSIWAYLTYLLLPLLYVWIRCYIRVKLTKVHKRTSMPSKPVPKSRLSDVKLTFIPVIFLVLRLFASGLSIPHTYFSYEHRLEFRKTWLNAALVLIAGVGTSAQGLMNAILFCAFTKVVRQRLVHSMKRVFCCWRGRSTKIYALQPTPPPSGTGQNDSSDEEDESSLREGYLTKHLLASSGSVSNYQSVNQRISCVAD